MYKRQFRGQGRETSQRVFTKLRKTQNYAKFLLTTPQKYDILSITLLYFGGRELYYFSTEFYHFTTEF